jgi:hypothetical protein
MATWGLSDLVQNPAALPAPPPQADDQFVDVIDVGGSKDAPKGEPGSQFARTAATGAAASEPNRMGVPTARATPDDATHTGSGWGLSDIVQNPEALKAAPAESAGAAAPEAPAVPAGKQTGVLANMGAGTSDATAGALGAPVDIATGAINLIPKGINAVAGTHIPTIQNPVGGSDWWKDKFGYIGADPRDVVPADASEQSARAAGSGAASMVLPWAGARALPALAGIPGALQRALGSGSAATQAAIGVGAGTGGQMAANAVPEPYKPLADFAGQVAGGGLVGAVPAAVGGAIGTAGHMAGNFLKPMKLAGQEQLAGQRILNAASDPAAVRESLANPAPQLVPGSEPTTFQATGDQGLGNLERAVAKNSPDQFIARANQQNAARVAHIGGLQAAGDPDAVARSFRAQLANIDSQSESVGAAHHRNAQRATDAIGNAPPADEEARNSTLQAFGTRLQGGLSALGQARKEAASRLYSAVDPDGKLTVDLRGFRNSVHEIARDRPANAAPLEGEAGRAFATAQLQPSVQTFKEIQALRQRIGDAMTAERKANGSTQTYAYLTRLRSALDTAIDETVSKAAAEDGSIGDRLREYENADSSGIRSDVPGGHTGTGGASDVSERAGNQDAGGRGGRLGQGDKGVSAGSADALKGSSRKAETLIDYLISRGGVRDQGGELAGQDLDRIHHRAGGRLINNTKGLTLDYAREAAIQEGFLPANADINDLKDALQSRAPVYRIDEAADDWLRQKTAREARFNDEARYNARDNVAMALDESGQRLAPAEIEHATDLHMQGVPVDEAIRQAAQATEDRAYQRNAEYNNVGSPGVPPAARQTALEAPENGLTANFDAAAASRYRSANANYADYAQTYKNAPGVGDVLRTGDRPGAFKMGASQVPANLFKSGPGAAERIQAFQRAAAGNPSLIQDLQDYAAFSLRRAAEDEDGTLNPAKAERWLSSHAEALSAFPDLRARMSDAVSARQAMDVAAARQFDARKAFESDAVKRVIGSDNPAATIGRILTSDSGPSMMQDLARKTAGDPAARAGLRRAVVQHILDNVRSNALAGDERLIKNDAFQTLARKSSAALRAIFSDDEIKSIQNVAEDMQRSTKSVSGTKLPGGSNTAQDLAAGETHGSHAPSVMNSLIALEVGGEALAHVTGSMGRVVGMVGTGVMNAMRANGLARVDDLVTQAMLNPALARTLLSKVPANAGQARAIGKIIAGQIQALSINSAISASGKNYDEK